MDSIFCIFGPAMADCFAGQRPHPPIAEHPMPCHPDGWLIALIICITVIVVAIIVALTVTAWHKAEIGKTKNANTNKGNTPSLEEKNRYEYITKLLQTRQELAKKESTLKAPTDEGCKAYLDLLTQLAGLSDTNTPSET